MKIVCIIIEPDGTSPSYLSTGHILIEKDDSKIWRSAALETYWKNGPDKDELLNLAKLQNLPIIIKQKYSLYHPYIYAEYERALNEIGMHNS